MMMMYDDEVLSGVTRVGDTRGGNWGCHPYFSWKKPDDLFYSSPIHRSASYAVSPLFIFSKKLTTFFAIHRHFYWFYSNLSPPPLEGVALHLFHLSNLVCPLFIINLPTKNFSTPWRVSPGAVRPLAPLLVTPLDVLILIFSNRKSSLKYMRRSLD